MKSPKPVIAGALLAGGLLVGGGVALAAEVELPTEASDVARTATSEPQAQAEEVRQDDANRPAEDEVTETESETAEVEATETDATEDEGDGEGERPTDTHGYTVSQLATTTEAEGAEKGALISTEARSHGEAQRAAHAPEDAGDAGTAGSAGKARAAEARSGR